MGNVPADTPDATVMLIGTYAGETSVGARLHQLPDNVVISDFESPLIGLLAAELVNDRPGQEAVLDRLLDLLLVSCLREALGDNHTQGWLAAEDDPVAGPALRLIHEHPQEPWTVQSWRPTPESRARLFARRFTEKVGEPPLTHLTNWRMALAADPSPELISLSKR